MSAIIAKFRRDRGLTFATTTDAQRQESRESWPGLDIFATVALLAVILVVCSYFLG